MFLESERHIHTDREREREREGRGKISLHKLWISLFMNALTKRHFDINASDGAQCVYGTQSVFFTTILNDGYYCNLPTLLCGTKQLCNCVMLENVMI